MKKLLIILLLFISVTSYGQKKFIVFGNGTEDIFKGEQTADRTFLSDGTFLWSLDALVSGPLMTFNKEESYLETSFLAGVGGAVGFKHYKARSDSSAVSDWGVNLAILTNVKINEAVKTGAVIGVLANIYNFEIGPAYLVNDKKLGVLVGATIKF